MNTLTGICSSYQAIPIVQGTIFNHKNQARLYMYEYFSSLTKVAFKELSTSLSFKLQTSSTVFRGNVTSSGHSATSALLLLFDERTSELTYC